MAPEVVKNSVASSQNMHIGHERVVAIPGEPPRAAKNHTAAISVQVELKSQMFWICSLPSRLQVGGNEQALLCLACVGGLDTFQRELLWIFSSSLHHGHPGTSQLPAPVPATALTT